MMYRTNTRAKWIRRERERVNDNNDANDDWNTDSLALEERIRGKTDAQRDSVEGILCLLQRFSGGRWPINWKLKALPTHHICVSEITLIIICSTRPGHMKYAQLDYMSIFVIFLGSQKANQALEQIYATECQCFVWPLQIAIHRSPDD